MTRQLFSKASHLYEKAITKEITPDDLDTVIAWPQEQLSVLFACTDRIRRHFFRDTVDPCTLLNIKSGDCSEDCAFCSQSSHNHAEITKKGLASAEQIVDSFTNAKMNNLAFCVVSSGKRLSSPEIRLVADALGKVDHEAHASLGILSDEDFAVLKKAGVVCYNHNLETSREFFGTIVTTHTYDQRIETVKRAKKAGLKVCCGGIFGLGESWQDRKSLCLELKSLDVDTIPINFLNPISGTRVKPPKEGPYDFLKIVALFRLAHPDKIIKVCGGRELHLGKLQPLMFLAGANGFVSGGYLTTGGDGIASDNAMIETMGMTKQCLGTWDRVSIKETP